MRRNKSLQKLVQRGALLRSDDRCCRTVRTPSAKVRAAASGLGLRPLVHNHEPSQCSSCRPELDLHYVKSMSAVMSSILLQVPLLRQVVHRLARHV